MLSRLVLPAAGALALMTSGAAAADLFATYDPAPPVVDQPVELGTGWYLRGDAAFLREQSPQVSGAIVASGTRNAYEGDLGFGYKFNNWFRADVTGGWGSVSKGSVVAAANTWCPYQSRIVTDQTTGLIVGVGYDPNETCTPKQRVGFSERNILLNGYIDFGVFGGFTPYAGLGVGVANLRSQYNLDFYKTSDGSLYDNVNLTPSGSYVACWINNAGSCVATNVPFTTQSWSRSASGVKYNFAWAAMAGFAFDISDHAKLDVGYRYLNLGSYSTVGATYDWSNGAPVVTSVAKTTKTLSSQSVKVGVRYMID